MNERGTVVRVRLDPVAGSEQAGTRPAVVISPTILNEHSRVVIVAPVTSKKVDRIHPFEVLLEEGTCGLDERSKVLVNQIRTIDKGRIVGTYGVISSDQKERLAEALEIVLGLVET